MKNVLHSQSTAKSSRCAREFGNQREARDNYTTLFRLTSCYVSRSIAHAHRTLQQLKHRSLYLMEAFVDPGPSL